VTILILIALTKKGEKISKVDYKLRSEDFCAEIGVDVGIFGYLMCFIDTYYKDHRDIFIVGQKAYFLVKINSDLNPRKCSCNSDADIYDESKALIKFSSVTLVTVSVRFESTGKVIRLWEEGKISLEDSGTGIKLETTSGDGTSFSKNQVAFSFTFTQKLFSSLKQQGKEKVTISAEVEVHYSDQSKKRMTYDILADSTDKNTFDVSPEVRDDSYSSSVELFVSFFIMFILSLI